MQDCFLFDDIQYAFAAAVLRLSCNLMQNKIMVLLRVLCVCHVAHHRAEIIRLRAEQLLAVLRRAGTFLVLCRVKCRTHRKRQNKVQRRCQNKALRYAVQAEKGRQNSIRAE